MNQGTGTTFKKEFCPGDSIRFKSVETSAMKVEDQVIEAVISDT